MVPQDATHVFKQSWLQFGINLREAVLRAEHDVAVERTERLRHDGPPAAISKRQDFRPFGAGARRVQITRGLRPWLLTFAASRRRSRVCLPTSGTIS